MNIFGWCVAAFVMGFLSGVVLMVLIRGNGEDGNVPKK